MPVAAPFEPKVEAEPALQHEWFGSSRLLQGKKPVAKDKDKSGTYQVQRKADTITLAKKLAVPTAALVLVGVCVGGYFAFDGEGGKKAHATAAPKIAAVEAKAPAADIKPVPVETPAPAPTEMAAKPADPATPPPAPTPAITPAPTATPVALTEVKTPPPNQALAGSDTTTIKTTRGEVKLVDVRIDSTPAGATVMLVDRGKTTFLGTTPIATQIETSRSYDVVFTAANHPTQVEHLDPNTTHRMAVTLGTPGNTAVVKPAAAIAAAPPAEHHHHHHDAPVVATAAAVAPPAHHDAPKKGAIVDPFATAPAPAATGTGTLMVSSKPPCEILVDGKDTGMMTPQRSMSLSAGKHKVTFVNAAQSINKTVGIQIAADKPTKLIQDLMKK